MPRQATSARANITTSEPPADGVIRCTLVLSTRNALPSVHQVCQYPPSRPANKNPDALPPPGHLDYARFEPLYGASPSALAEVGSFATRKGLRVVDRDSRLENDILTGAVALKATVTLEGQQSAFEGIESLAGVTYVFGALPLPRAPRARALMQGGHEESLLKAAPPASTTYSAKQVAQVYDYPQPHPSLPGAGQCLGLIEMAGVASAEDFATYFQKYGPEPVIVHVTPTENPPLSDLTFNVEVTMDVELAGSVCPGAKIVVYNQQSQDFSVQDFYSIMATAIFDTQNRPSVLSVAWCAPEGAALGISAAEEGPLNELLVKAALLGITICAPAGDFGSLNPVNMCMEGPIMGPVTCYPAASPLVLACGGTKLIAEGAQLKDESVWNQMAQRWRIEGDDSTVVYDGFGGASGGGVSCLNPLPPYQEAFGVPQAVTMTTRDTVLQPIQRYRGRGIPDIAASADLLHGYDIYFDGKWGAGGATSAASPVLAGLIIRLNQKLGRRLGFIHPFLYELQREKKNLFRTIEKGSNGGYDARPGDVWNACTGLGSPIGKNILKALEKLYG